MAYGGRDLEKIYPEIAAAANKDAGKPFKHPPDTARRQSEEFERRLRAKDTLPPRKRPNQD